MTMPASFFDYTCDRCGSPVCERVQVMNLALDYVDELFCLPCLSEMQQMSEPELADFVRTYIYSRECFKTPWDQFQAQTLVCPWLAEHRCFCQDTAS